MWADIDSCCRLCVLQILLIPDKSSQYLEINKANIIVHESGSCEGCHDIFTIDDWLVRQFMSEIKDLTVVMIANNEGTCQATETRNLFLLFSSLRATPNILLLWCSTKMEQKNKTMAQFGLH